MARKKHTSTWDSLYDFLYTIVQKNPDFISGILIGLTLGMTILSAVFFCADKENFYSNKINFSDLVEILVIPATGYLLSRSLSKQTRTDNIQDKQLTIDKENAIEYCKKCEELLKEIRSEVGNELANLRSQSPVRYVIYSERLRHRVLELIREHDNYLLKLDFKDPLLNFSQDFQRVCNDRIASHYKRASDKCEMYFTGETAEPFGSRVSLKKLDQHHRDCSALFHEAIDCLVQMRHVINTIQ